MVDPILHDRKRVLPCPAFLEGECGIRDLFVGVPVKLGAGGIEQIFEAKLTEEEGAALQKSAAAVKELVNVMASKLDPSADAAEVADLEEIRSPQASLPDLLSRTGGGSKPKSCMQKRVAG